MKTIISTLTIAILFSLMNMKAQEYTAEIKKMLATQTEVDMEVYDASLEGIFKFKCYISGDSLYAKGVSLMTATALKDVDFSKSTIGGDKYNRVGNTPNFAYIIHLEKLPGKKSYYIHSDKRNDPASSVVDLFFKSKPFAQQAFDYLKKLAQGGNTGNNNSATKEATVIKPEKPLTFTDSRDNKIYKTVKIGTQTWMAENMAFKTSSGCWALDNKSENVAIYGYLYTWKTASTACPVGWHLPSSKEWTILIDYLGGADASESKLKSATGWYYDFGTKGTNSSGFSALPGGERESDDFYDSEEEFNLGKVEAYWWTSTKAPSENYYLFKSLGVKFTTEDKGRQHNCGLSVRCIKD